MALVYSVRWRLGRVAAGLAGCVLWLRALGGVVPSPADTAAVFGLLRQGEAVESQRPDQAARLYARALARAEQIGFGAAYFRSVMRLTFALNSLGQHEKAQHLAARALARAQQDTSNYHRGICHFALGVTAWKQGNAAEAVRQYHRAERYMARAHNAYNLDVVRGNLAVIYQQQGLLDRAVEELLLVLQSQQREGPNTPRRALAITHFNLATTYWMQKKGAQAKRHFRLTQQYVDGRKDLDVLVPLHNNLGQVFVAEAEKTPAGPGRQALFDSAFWHHRRALQLSRQLRNPVEELHELHALAALYVAQQRYAPALPLLHRALRMVRRHGNAPAERVSIYHQLYLLHQGQRRYEAAYRWRDRYEAVADSLETQATKDLIEGYRLREKQAAARAKLEAKQTQINRLQEERHRQRLWLGLAVAAALGGAALLLLGYLYYRQRQRTHAAALLALQREQDLLAVRAEMQGQRKERVRIAREVHDDMGASLTVIGLLSEVMKTRPETAAAPEVEKISAVSADLVSTMNQIIWSLNPSNDSLNGLIAYVRAYAREFLENTPLRLRVETEEVPADVSIAGDDRRHVFLAVKEALHNVVKHAGAACVTLRLLARGGVLHVEVCDDGRGFGPSGPQPKPGRNGLANMTQRLRQAGGSCEVRAGAGGGTCVELRYPYAEVAAAVQA